MNRHLIQGIFSIVVFASMLMLGLSAADSSATQNDFELDSNCPKGFELVAGNRCELRTLYQFYTSTQDRGLGGTHSNLPKHRDGFSPQQIDLGRYLFFDPLLSGEQDLSCASCHQPDKGFADGKAHSLGANGRLSKRSTPSLWNSAFLTSFFWDARAKNLEQQALGPLYAADEMNNNPSKLLNSLTSNATYRRLFSEAFKSNTVASDNGLTINNLVTALTAFQASLISLNSRYDEYAHGNHDALNDDEIAGLNVFRSFVARCSECHTPPLFTNNQIAVIGVPEKDGDEFDIGAETTYALSKLKGGFKVPSLRNIAETAPYMHAGNFETLREATEFYNKGRGHAVPEGMDLSLHWHISEPDLSDRELDLIVTFMKTLSDDKFMPQVPSHVPSGLAPLR
ncbi:MAG: cytochrome c peroxidase [Arenicella sp.]|jgi:cytochrome c peroxidase